MHVHVALKSLSRRQANLWFALVPLHGVPAPHVLVGGSRKPLSAALSFNSSSFAAAATAHDRASAVIFASSASKQGGSAKAVDYEG